MRHHKYFIRSLYFFIVEREFQERELKNIRIKYIFIILF